MGKSLVIKGADFTTNGIQTLVGWVGGYTDENLHQPNTITGDNIYIVAPAEITRLNMIGKTIKYIKIYAVATGYIKVYKADLSTQPPYSVSNEQTIAVTQTGINVVELNTPITISSSNGIALVGKNIITYAMSATSNPEKGWLYFVANAGTEISSVRIPVDWGYNL